VNYLDFDRQLIRQRNDELLREVQELRLEERLRANHRPRSKRFRVNSLIRQIVLSLLSGARSSE
jgi:hypothetical protein